MRRYTVRQSFTVPIGVKAQIKDAAKARGLSMSAHLREVIDDYIAAAELEKALHDIKAQMAATR